VATQFGFSPGNLIRFYRGLSGGAFAAPVTVASFDSNARVVAGQFNAGVDTFLDIAVASDTLNEVRVYFGNGAGGFGPPITLVKRPDLPYFSLSDFVRGDLNGDAFPDLVTLVQEPDGGATAYGLLGSAAGSFTVVATRLAPNSGFPLNSLTVAQVAGSTAGDVIGIASFSPPVLGLLLGDGTGHFTATPIPLTSISFTIGDSYFGKNLAVGDFDQNGTLDVALADLHPVEGPPNFTRSFIDLLLGDGHGGFTLSARYAVPESFQFSVVAADFDGDGHLDIASTGAWFGPGSPGAKVTTASGNGAGGIAALDTIWGLAEFPTVMTATDLDGDHRIDLLVSDVVPAYSVLLNRMPATEPPPPLPLQVALDVSPGKFPNRIHPKSRKNIAVAILTTATFNATTVNAATVRFGATGIEAAPVKYALKDVNKDGAPDMLLRFKTRDTGIGCGQTSASLTGETVGGQALQGSDAIVTMCGKKRPPPH